MFSPEPPQGFSSEQSQVVIQRQPIPLYNPPQTRRRPTGVETFRVIATFPPPATAAFQFFRFYQINKNQASGITTNVPVVIIDSLPAGTILEGAGLDIRVFDSSGNPIPYESIDIELLGGGAANIEIWLNMPVVKDFEFVQLAFGNAIATDGSNPNGVYDANYKGVYHLNQTVFGVGSIIDSTVNANNADTVGGISSIVGPVGKAIDFASESHIDEGIALLEDMNDVGTISMWVNIDDLDDGSSSIRFFYTLAKDSDRWEVLIDITTDPNDLSFRFGDGTALLRVSLPTSVVNSGEDHLYTFTWDQPNSIARIYIDGILFATHTTSWPLDTTSGEITVLGNFNGGLSFTSLLGNIDEARFSDIVRDSDRILTEFNNQNDNDAFWFKTPILTVSQNNFLVDDQGNNIVTEIP